MTGDILTLGESERNVPFSVRRRAAGERLRILSRFSWDSLKAAKIRRSPRRLDSGFNSKRTSPPGSSRGFKSPLRASPSSALATSSAGRSQSELKLADVPLVFRPFGEHDQEIPDDKGSTTLSTNNDRFSGSSSGTSFLKSDGNMEGRCYIPNCAFGYNPERVQTWRPVSRIANG